MEETDDYRALKEPGTFRVIRPGMTDESGPCIVPMCLAVENRSISP